MKQAGYTKRPQSRPPERHRPHQRQTNGNPQQFVEKYLTLARDAASSGDPISAENYYQYADHYYRLVVASRTLRPSSPVRRGEVKEEPLPQPVTSQGPDITLE